MFFCKSFVFHPCSVFSVTLHTSDYHFGICIWESSQGDLSVKQKTVDEIDATERVKFRCIDELRKIIPYGRTER